MVSAALSKIRLEHKLIAEAKTRFLREKALGPDHPEVAKVQYNLARLFSAERRFGEAEALLKCALEIYERAPKVNPERIVETPNEYVLLLRASGRPAEAGKLKD